MANQNDRQDALDDLETAKKDGVVAKEAEATAQENLADVAREEAAEAERQAQAVRDTAEDEKQ